MRVCDPGRSTLCSRLEEMVPQNAGANRTALESERKRERNTHREKGSEKKKKRQELCLTVSEHKVLFFFFSLVIFSQDQQTEYPKLLLKAEEIWF